MYSHKLFDLPSYFRYYHRHVDVFLSQKNKLEPVAVPKFIGTCGSFPVGTNNSYGFKREHGKPRPDACVSVFRRFPVNLAGTTIGVTTFPGNKVHPGFLAL